MNSSNDLSPSPDAASTADAAEIASLRSLLQISVLASLITATAFGVYGFWHYRSLARDREAQATALKELPTAIQQLDEMVRLLSDYAKDHLKFQEVLARQGIQIGGSGGAEAARPPSDAPRR